jgi:hypothetical protein
MKWPNDPTKDTVDEYHREKASLAYQRFSRNIARTDDVSQRIPSTQIVEIENQAPQNAKSRVFLVVLISSECHRHKHSSVRAETETKTYS